MGPEDHMTIEEPPELRPLQRTLSKLSSTSLAIPANEDFHFFKEFKRPVDEIAGSSQCVLETIGGSALVGGKSLTLAGDIDGDDTCDCLANVNNEILEKVDASMDEYKEIRKKEEESKNKIVGSKNDTKVAEKNKVNVSFHVPTIKKPQQEYRISVNNANIPFKHVWLEKSDDGLRLIHPLVSKFDFVEEEVPFFCLIVDFSSSISEHGTVIFDV